MYPPLYAIPERQPIGSPIHDKQIKVSPGEKRLNNQQQKVLRERMQEVHTFFYDKFGIEAVPPEEIFPPMLGRKNPDNAEWTSDVKKGWNFGSRSISPETVAHEYIHAVVQQITNLGNDDEGSALDESLADVFASIFKQYKAGQSVDKADWLMTDEGKSYRSVKRFPAEIKYPNLSGEAHDDAAIPNYAFYYAATQIGGNSWEIIGKIWCEAMKNTKPMKNVVSFRDFISFSRATIEATKKLSPQHKDIVKTAWKKVGVEAKFKPLFL